MHETTFTDALLPPPVTVLRLPLKPYSLGHEILLLRQRNAFLTHTEFHFNCLDVLAQKRQLRMAALICSNTWADNHKPARGLRLWGWLIRNAVYPLEIANFRNYLAEAYETVFYTLNPKKEDDVRADDMCADEHGYEPLHKLRGRSLGAPLIARLLQFVTSDQLYGAHGHATPYDFPYAAALNFYLAHLESQGSTRIEGEAEAEAKRAWAADVEWAKEEEAKRGASRTGDQPDTSHPAPDTIPGLATPPPDLNAPEVIPIADSGTGPQNARGGSPHG